MGRKHPSFDTELVTELQKHIPTLGRPSAIDLAKRIGQLVEMFFRKAEQVRSGQLLWAAIDQNDPGYRKRIEQTKLKPVVPDLLTEEQFRSTGIPRRQVRTEIAVRLLEQAKAQGGLLTTYDVAAILCTSARTVQSHVRAYERASGNVVPKRAVLHDIGPGVSHRVKICDKILIEKRSVEQTARETHHSVAAVNRYLKDFRRTRLCLKAGLTVEQTAYLTQLSVPLVKKYRALQTEHLHRLTFHLLLLPFYPKRRYDVPVSCRCEPGRNPTEHRPLFTCGTISASLRAVSVLLNASWSSQTNSTGSSIRFNSSYLS